MMRPNQVKHLYVHSDTADIPLKLTPMDENGGVTTRIESKVEEDTVDDVIVKEQDEQPVIEMRENKSRKRSRGQSVVSL